MDTLTDMVRALRSVEELLTYSDAILEEVAYLMLQGVPTAKALTRARDQIEREVRATVALRRRMGSSS